jgi:hypothetical protein
MSSKILTSNIKVGDPYNFYCALKSINRQNKQTALRWEDSINRPEHFVRVLEGN